MGFLKSALITSSFVVLSTLLAVPAKASLLLEPYVGYQMSTISLETSSQTTKYAFNQPAFGARVGFAKSMFWIAADYMTTSGSTTVASAPAGVDAASITTYNWANTKLGLDVGVKIPLIQAYVGYVFQDNNVYKLPSGDATFKGSGFRAGVGFTGLPFVAINLEYMMATYTKVEANSVEATIGDSASTNVNSASDSTLMLSVSAPFRLF